MLAKAAAASQFDTDCLIIGGGLGGLTAALHLARAGWRTLLLERGAWPRHRVCGEYVSNEVLPYLGELGADPASLDPARINRLLVSTPSGRVLRAPLDLGGFGVSRYALDAFLVERAAAAGADCRSQATVQDFVFDAALDGFRVRLSGGQELTTRVVLGAFGKRSNLDRTLERRFFAARSPWMAVKQHLRGQPVPPDLIALHNFPGGYAGVSAVEGENRYCFCYLTTRQALRQAGGTIAALEARTLARNPHLRELFATTEPLLPQPEVINEISFAPKPCVERHALLVGDAAGLITPLCGNGMAMAIHGARLASEQVDAFLHQRIARAELEVRYATAWRAMFSLRLRVGRAVQASFGGALLTEAVVGALRGWPAAVRWLVRHSHGNA